MKTLVDTSALFALLEADDANHFPAATWLRSSGSVDDLVTHNYVVVETAALVHRRLGRRAVRALFDDLLPLLEQVFVDPTLHASAARAWLYDAGAVSLVDWVSFEVIGKHRIDRAFAFDRDFAERGITLVP